MDQVVHAIKSVSPWHKNCTGTLPQDCALRSGAGHSLMDRPKRGRPAGVRVGEKTSSGQAPMSALCHFRTKCIVANGLLFDHFVRAGKRCNRGSRVSALAALRLISRISGIDLDDLQPIVKYPSCLAQISHQVAAWTSLAPAQRNIPRRFRGRCDWPQCHAERPGAE